MRALQEKKLKGEILNLTLKNIILIGTISGGIFGTLVAILAILITRV